MTDRLIFGITADPKAGNPDQQAERLAMTTAWDEHITQEVAKRPYLLGKAPGWLERPRQRRLTGTRTGMPGHA